MNPSSVVALDSGRSRGRLANWGPDKRTITDALVKDAGVTLGRCRDAVRNVPWCARAAQAFASAAVGYGIRPRPPVVASKRQRKKLVDVWSEWVEEADADGRTDFYGLQALAARELFVAGEIFFRRRWRRTEDGLTVPFQLQALRAEMLPMWLNGEAGALMPGMPSGNSIRSGIEFDAIGRRVAYYFHRQDPGDSAYRAPLQMPLDGYVRVPAEDVIHVSQVVEPGQVRGLPPMAAGLVRVYETDRYMDAQLARQHASALIALIVKPAYDGSTVWSRAAEEAASQVTLEGADATASAAATSGRTVEDMALEPNTILTLRQGEEALPMPLPDVGSDFDNFILRAACDVAVAFGIPYSLMTGDLRQTSYANERSAVQAFKRDIQQLQFSTLVFQACKPVWAWFLDAATTFGAVSLPGYATKRKSYQRVEWIPAEWEWVDPLKDMQAKLLAVDGKIIPRSYLQTEMGYDPEETDEEIIRCDERRMAMAPTDPLAQQPAAPQQDEEDPADGGDEEDDG